MIAVAEQPSARLVDDPVVYTPERVRSLLSRWGEIIALSETPQSARGLLQPGETREAPRLKRPKGYHGDPLAWANVVADIEHAWYAMLGDGQSLEARMRWTVVAHKMRGLTLGEIGVILRVRTSEVGDVFGAACNQMATTLGWVEPPES